MTPHKLANGKVRAGRFLSVMSIIMIVVGGLFCVVDFQYFWKLDEMVANGHIQAVMDFSGLEYDTAVNCYYATLVEGCVQSILMIICGVFGLQVARGKGKITICQVLAILVLSLTILIFIIVGFVFGFENMGPEAYILNITIQALFFVAVKREAASPYWVDLEKSNMQTVSELLQTKKRSANNCSITIRPSAIEGTLAIPVIGSTDFFKNEIETAGSNLMVASFSMKDGRLAFQTQDARFQNLLEGFQSYMSYERTQAIVDIAPTDELLVFLYYVIKDDSARLSNWRDSLHILEDIINSPNKDIPHDFELYVGNARNELYTLERFYEQVVELCQTISITPLLKLNDISRSQFEILATKAKRYALEAQQAADYAMQIRELKESRMEAKQTEISTVLTVVATVCMSISLITGWYGMNFANMPELQNKLAYMVIILLCIIVVTVEMAYFKHKKWF